MSSVDDQLENLIDSGLLENCYALVHRYQSGSTYVGLFVGLKDVYSSISGDFDDEDVEVPLTFEQLVQNIGAGDNYYVEYPDNTFYEGAEVFKVQSDMLWGFLRSIMETTEVT